MHMKGEGIMCIGKGFPVIFSSFQSNPDSKKKPQEETPSADSKSFSWSKAAMNDRHPDTANGG